MLDFGIELSHFPDRTLAWEWVTYDPRNVKMTLHHRRGALCNPSRRAQGCRGVHDEPRDTEVHLD
jgi:hypothetical protein